MSVKPLTALLGAVAIAYPLLVYAGIGHLSPKLLALLLAGMALARALVARQAMWWAVAAAAGVLALLASVSDALLPLKLYPVLVNALFLLVFSVSLFRPPTVIERLARVTEGDLSPVAVAYTRRVTQVWCGFFVVNGSVALATAFWASDEIWALYNGLISYGLMGVLFGVEWLVRQRVKERDRAAIDTNEQVPMNQPARPLTGPGAAHD
ncbi:MAG: hypothetical protein RLZZ618_2357 [Pseudomonadota bacterium]|jgi:uncharacterized membrane protein